MTAVTVVYIAVLAACALASGFFSGSETALIGIGRERVHQLSGQGRRGERVAELVADPDRLLSTLLVANNLVNILGAAVATTLFIQLLGEEWGPWVATVAVTAVVLVVGEITPKTIAARYPDRFSLAVAPTIWRLSIVLRPIAHFFVSITRALLRLVGLGNDDSDSGVTEADVLALASMGVQHGEIDDVESEILHALFTLADRPVREVMTPRMDMATLRFPATIAEVREMVATTGHSRYPVTSGDPDELLGVFYVKDLLQLPDSAPTDAVSSLLRSPQFIPESTSVLHVLQDMRKERFGFGVIVDEHGGVEGIVTVKDLVAELVGTLRDEYDPGEPTAVKIDDATWLTDGRLPIEDLEEAIDDELPEGPYSTTAGLFLAVAGRIPHEGDSITVDGVTLTVIAMDRNRIDKVRVDLIAAPTEA